MDLNLDFTLQDKVTPSTAGRHLAAIVTALANKYALFGIRGDGKTIASLAAIVGHAQRHEQAGYPLPVPWMGVRDTFAIHKLATIKSLQNPLWGGCWGAQRRLSSSSVQAGSKEYVHLQLMGVEDQNAIDKLRQETVGVWFQECAPVLEESSGISDTAWGLPAALSARRPTHYTKRHPLVHQTRAVGASKP